MFQKPPERYPWNRTPVSIPWELPSHQPSCKLLQEEPSKLDSTSASEARLQGSHCRHVRYVVCLSLAHVVIPLCLSVYACARETPGSWCMTVKPLHKVQFAILAPPVARARDVSHVSLLRLWAGQQNAFCSRAARSTGLFGRLEWTGGPSGGCYMLLTTLVLWSGFGFVPR